MGVEEGGGLMSDQEVQWSLIEFIIRQHKPFPDEPFHPRSITVHVRTRPWLPFRRSVRLSPVAFEPRISAIDMMGYVSMHGGMSPYLFLDPNQHLVRRVVDRKGNYRYVYVTDPFSITREDIDRLEIGIQGDNELLKVEREKAFDAIMRDFGYAS